MTQIKIISPSEGQTILGDEVTISFIVSDFTPGQDGYLNLWLDDTKNEASTAAKITSQFDYTLSEIPAGPHSLTLEAKAANNNPFYPRVVATVSFTTTLPQIPTPTHQPTSKNILSFVSFLNWQYILIIVASVVVIVGIVVKSTFGKPIRE